jgi:hypothetical protein
MSVNLLKLEPVQLVEACIAELTTRMNSDQAQPMSPIARGCLRLDGKKLPPSLNRYLQYDCKFYSMCNDWGAFENVGAIGAETPHEWEPVEIRTEIIQAIEGSAWRPFEELKLKTGKFDLLTDPIKYLKLELKGKLFTLPNVGNQTHYMYVGVPCANGEYPVLGMEMKGEMRTDTVFWGELNVWVKYPNFAVYLYDQIFDGAVFPEDFAAEVDEIYRLNPELCKNFSNSLDLLSGNSFQ